MTVTALATWLAAGALLGFGVCGLVAGLRSGATGAGLRAHLRRLGLMLALTLQSAALALHAGVSQRAIGTYWSGRRGECLALVGWLVTALVTVGLTRLHWRGRWAAVAYTAALAVVVALAFAAPLG